MGILDGLLGLKTTGATDAATNSQIGWLWNVNNSANNVLTSQYGDARSDLTGNAQSALSSLASGYGGAESDVAGYGGAAQQSLGGYTGQAVGTALAGNDAYSPYVASGGQSSGTLANALGLNGSAGNMAAVSAFQGSPGYQYSVDQATDQAQRAAAASGMNASGNTLQAVTQLASNLANQNYQSWLTNLSGLGTQGLTAAAGQSSNDQKASGDLSTAGTTAATTLNTIGQNLGTLGANSANQTASTYNTLGSNLDNNDTGLGQLISTNILNTQAAASKLALGDATAQDSANSSNNGILSQLLMGTPASGNNPGTSGLLGLAKSTLKL